MYFADSIAEVRINKHTNRKQHALSSNSDDSSVLLVGSVFLSGFLVPAIMNNKIDTPIHRAPSSVFLIGFACMMIFLLLPQGCVAQDNSTPSDGDLPDPASIPNPAHDPTNPGYDPNIDKPRPKSSASGSPSLPRRVQSADTTPRPNSRRTQETTGGLQSGPDPYNSATRDPVLATEAKSEPQYDPSSTTGGSPLLPIVASKLDDATGYAIFSHALSTSGVNLVNEQGAITIFATSDDAFNNLLPAVQQCIFTIPARR